MNSHTWRDVRATQNRRVRRGKRAPRDNTVAMAKDTQAVPQGIHCCVCLNRGGKRVQADTIIKGYATCSDHSALVSEPNFDIMMLRTTGGPV